MHTAHDGSNDTNQKQWRQYFMPLHIDDVQSELSYDRGAVLYPLV